MRQVFLIGFMACGKSTLGKKLSLESGYTFLDLDSLIEDREQKTIPEIFRDKGEGYFREIERQRLLELLGKPRTIVAVGGGAPCYQDNMDLMIARGVTVYLDIPVSTLLLRLKESWHHRPLIPVGKEEDLETFIITTLKQREPFYLRAAFHFQDPGTALFCLMPLLKN